MSSKIQYKVSVDSSDFLKMYKNSCNSVVKTVLFVYYLSL